MGYVIEEKTKETISTFRGERNHTIDSIRGICILCIIITHYTFSEAERLKYLFPFWINMAVPVFMILSGYVNMQSFKAQSISCIKDAYNFHFVKRITRFTIPFLLFYIIELVLANFPFIHEISDITLYHFNIWIFLAGGIGPGSYYYPIMIQFIILFPFVFILIDKYNSLGLLLGFIINISFEILQRAYGMNENCYRLLIFRYTFLIFYGGFLYKNRKRKIRFIWGILSTLAGASYLFMTQYIGYKTHIIIYWQQTSIVACLFVIPIISFIIKRASIRCQLIELFGKASFNIFLIQMIYYTFFAEYFYSFSNNKILQIITGLVICLSAGCLFWFMEQRMTQWVVQKEKYIFYRVQKIHLKELVDEWLFQ